MYVCLREWAPQQCVSISLFIIMCLCVCVNVSLIVWKNSEILIHEHLMNWHKRWGNKLRRRRKRKTQIFPLTIGIYFIHWRTDIHINIFSLFVHLKQYFHDLVHTITNSKLTHSNNQRINPFVDFCLFYCFFIVLVVVVVVVVVFVAVFISIPIFLMGFNKMNRFLLHAQFTVFHTSCRKEYLYSLANLLS